MTCSPNPSLNSPYRYLYRPSELHALLKQQGTKAKKRLSQNFLIDGNVIRKIIQAAKIRKGDFVIEIGPGPGALTEALLQAGAVVTAIEMDPIFANALKSFQENQTVLEVIQEDFLKFSLEKFFNRFPNRNYKIVANLPYHITTPILSQICPLYPKVTSLTIMVQKEFADRMVARVSTADYSSLTVFLEFYGTVSHRFDVSRRCFYPSPKVDSSVVHYELKPTDPKVKPDDFFQLTRSAFQQRRKMLRSSLKHLFGSNQIESTLLLLAKQATTRPEELSLKEWLDFFSILDKQKNQ